MPSSTFNIITYHPLIESTDNFHILVQALWYNLLQTKKNKCALILSQQPAQIPKSEMGLLRFLFYVAINEFPCWISFHNFLWNNISGERAQTSGESFQNSNNLTLISVSVFGSLELKRWLWLGVCIDPSKKVFDLVRPDVLPKLILIFWFFLGWWAK